MCFRIALFCNGVCFIKRHLTLTSTIYPTTDSGRPCDVHRSLTASLVAAFSIFERWYIFKLVWPAETEVIVHFLVISGVGTMLNRMCIVSAAVNLIVNDTYRSHLTTAVDILFHFATCNANMRVSSYDTGILHRCKEVCHSVGSNTCDNRAVVIRISDVTAVATAIDMAIDGWRT